MNGHTACPVTDAETERRLEALQILTSIEELIWAANRRNETLARTRMHYTQIVTGFEPPTPPRPTIVDAVWGDEPPPVPPLPPDPRVPRVRPTVSVDIKTEDDGDDGGVPLQAEEEVNGEPHDAEDDDGVEMQDANGGDDGGGNHDGGEAHSAAGG